MNLTTQIKAVHKTATHELKRAEKRLAKSEVALRSTATEHQTAKAEVAQKRAAMKQAEDMLKSNGGVAEKVKPGPKPKAVKIKAAPVAAAAPKKPGPKPKVAAKVATKTDKKPSRAAQGRREVASGKRPPIKDVIAKVLGKRVMHATQVYDIIKEKGQLPNSGDPRGYIGYLLSASKVTITRAGKDVEVPLFERVHEKGRGFYKNRGVAAGKSAPEPKKAAVKAAKPAKPAPAVKAAPKPKAAAKSAAPTKDGKRTVTCKVCGQPGHNSKGHARATGAAAAAPAAKPVKEAAPKPAKKEAAPKAAKVEGEKRTVTCKKCGEKGHNAKGHDRAIAAKAKTNGHTNGHTNGNGNGHSTSAEAKAEAKVEAAKVEVAKKEEPVKADREKSTDEILAEAGIDAGSVLGG